MFLEPVISKWPTQFSAHSENSTIVAQLKSCAADPGEAHVVISKNSGRREDVHVLNLAEIQ